MHINSPVMLNVYSLNLKPLNTLNKQLQTNKGSNAVSIESYVGFSATAGQIQVQRDPQILECLQVISEAFSRKLPEGVLIPLSCLFHLPFLEDTMRAHMQ